MKEDLKLVLQLKFFHLITSLRYNNLVLDTKATKSVRI